MLATELENMRTVCNGIFTPGILFVLSFITRVVSVALPSCSFVYRMENDETKYISYNAKNTHSESSIVPEHSSSSSSNNNKNLLTTFSMSMKCEF